MRTLGTQRAGIELPWKDGGWERTQKGGPEALALAVPIVGPFHNCNGMPI